MSIYLWQVFLTVAEEKSFVKAAEILNVSQSAVSHAINNLEKEYGYHLFIRNRNNVSLTTNGESILPLVQNLMECNKALVQHLDDLTKATAGEIRIGTFHSAAHMWLPDIIMNFHEKYPNIRITVKQSGDSEIAGLINRGELDLALLTQSIPSKGSFLPLHKTPTICLAPKGFIPANGRTVTPQDLDGKTIITQYEGYDTEMDLWFKRNKVNADFVYKMETDSTCHLYVERGLGFCLTPEMTYKCDPVKASVWPISPPEMRIIGLITVYPEYETPIVSLFKQEIVNYMNNSGLLNI